ncbi:hypothetical protein [Pollutibacter soli]|uniref:hypothetical protein n=1 Tax=Pollutibacter soli TaxID=3034157 RepID=UPI0030140A14
MKNVQRIFLTAVLICSVSLLKAQTADEVLNKHIEAIGGKAKVAGVTSVKTDITMQVMGNDAPSSTVILVGKGFKSEAEFQGQKIVQIITDKGGWAMNPMAGSSDLQPIPDDQYKNAKEQIYFTPFLDYAAQGAKVELAGTEKVGDKDAFKIKYTSKDGIVTSYLFDPTSYYLVKTVKTGEMMGQSVEVSTTYSDFKKTDYGVVIPYKTDIDLGGQFQLAYVTKKAEFNSAVDPAIFAVK